MELKFTCKLLYDPKIWSKKYWTLFLEKIYIKINQINTIKLDRDGKNLVSNPPQNMSSNFIFYYLLLRLKYY